MASAISEYFVSKEGKVYKNGREKKLTLDKNYLITMYMGKKWAVHRLVAEAYISNPLNKTQVNHINGNKLDNRVENLEWVTQQENLFHRDNIIKTCVWGEKAAKAKLSNSQVEEIRQRHSQGNITQRKLAEIYNVHPKTISRIINYETFSKYVQ